MKHKEVLIFVDWFFPGFKAGGPIKSIRNMILALGENFRFSIVTSNTDFGDGTPYSDVKTNCWIEKDNYRIIYLDVIGLRKNIKEILLTERYDFVYFNSLFSKSFTLYPLKVLKGIDEQHFKIVLAPRGMLGKGALAIKLVKKALFLRYAKWSKLYASITWHATNEGEKKDILSVFSDAEQIKIASNISLGEISKRDIDKTPGKLNMVFFSRISPKKNLDYALRILTNFDTEKINFDIYGVMEDLKYWEKCETIIKDAKLQAAYKGELRPDKVSDVLSGYHFLFMPTRHENYGHVIVEAAASGCGLIISDQTPWRNLDKEQVGWDIPLKREDRFKEVLLKCIEMGNEDYKVLRKNCYRYIKKELDTDQAVLMSSKLFE